MKQTCCSCIWLARIERRDLVAFESRMANRESLSPPPSDQDTGYSVTGGPVKQYMRSYDWFNRSRPHSALKGLPPLSAVNNLMRNHS